MKTHKDLRTRLTLNETAEEFHKLINWIARSKASNEMALLKVHEIMKNAHLIMKDPLLDKIIEIHEDTNKRLDDTYRELMALNEGLKAINEKIEGIEERLT